MQEVKSKESPRALVPFKCTATYHCFPITGRSVPLPTQRWMDLMWQEWVKRLIVYDCISCRVSIFRTWHLTLGFRHSANPTPRSCVWITNVICVQTLAFLDSWRNSSIKNLWHSDGNELWSHIRFNFHWSCDRHSNPSLFSLNHLSPARTHW